MERPLPTRLRGETYALAQEGRVAEALRVARSIDEPWFRCQALASAADADRDAHRRRVVLDEAFEAATETREPNRIVTVSAWPAGVLAKHGQHAALDRAIRRLCGVAATEPHPIRRFDGLFGLWQGIRRGGAAETSLRLLLLGLVDSARLGHGWKRDRHLGELAVDLFSLGWNTEAEACLALIEKPRVRRQALRWVGREAE